MKSAVKAITIMCAVCAVAFAQEKPGAAVYIKGEPEGRDFLMMAVNNYLIQSGKYRMVAVDAIDLIMTEQGRHYTHAVSDSTIAEVGHDVGAMFVCVVERTEYQGFSYLATRMVNVKTKVADLSELSELAAGEKLVDAVQRQVGRMLKIATPPDTAARPSNRRSRMSIMEVIMKNTPSVNAAYEARLRAKPGLKGQITVKFKIDEFGKTLSAAVTGSSVKDPELERIVIDKVKSWYFGKIDKPGDVTEAEYPFTFSQ